jgi:hypothetical protein
MFRTFFGKIWAEKVGLGVVVKDKKGKKGGQDISIDIN